MVTLLTTLGTIALSIGATHVADLIESNKARSNRVSSDEILKAVKMLVSAARSKGNKVLNQVYDKIQAINFPFGMGSSVKDYLTSIKREETDKYKSLRDSYSNIEQNLNNIEERASNFAAQTDVVRNRNKDQIDNLKDEVNQELSKVDNLTKGVENAI